MHSVRPIQPRVSPYKEQQEQGHMFQWLQSEHYTSSFGYLEKYKKLPILNRHLQLHQNVFYTLTIQEKRQTLHRATGRRHTWATMKEKIYVPAPEPA